MSRFQRFMAELRRRHVPQTVAVYAVAAWAAIQFADVVVPNLGWEQWVVTATIIAAAVGLPVVLALAWFLEWGPDGVHRTPDETPASTGIGERGTPVVPGPSYAPWAVAVGVLAVVIAGALIVVALGTAGDADTAMDDDGQTRSERRQGFRGPEAPIPPSISSPGFRDSLARAASDSVMQRLGEQGLEGLGPMIEMATRIGESAGRLATGGPLEIVAPETWAFGAPHPVEPGDTLVISGVARAEGGVAEILFEGAVVARGEAGETELPFETTWVIGVGRGYRQVTLTVRPHDGEAFERRFGVTVIPGDLGARPDADG